MALIDDQVAVTRHAVIDDPFLTRLWIMATSTCPVGLLRPPPMRPIDFAGRSEERRQPLNPLVEQLWR